MGNQDGWHKNNSFSFELINLKKVFADVRGCSRTFAGGAPMFEDVRGRSWTFEDVRGDVRGCSWTFAGNYKTIN